RARATTRPHTRVRGGWRPPRARRALKIGGKGPRAVGVVAVTSDWTARLWTPHRGTPAAPVPRAIVAGREVCAVTLPPPAQRAAQAQEDAPGKTSFTPPPRPRARAGGRDRSRAGRRPRRRGGGPRRGPWPARARSAPPPRARAARFPAPTRPRAPRARRPR